MATSGAGTNGQHDDGQAGTVALILVIFLSISGVVGFLFMPNTAGRSLEDLEAENYGEPRAAVAGEVRCV